MGLSAIELGPRINQVISSLVFLEFPSLLLVQSVHSAKFVCIVFKTPGTIRLAATILAPCGQSPNVSPHCHALPSTSALLLFVLLLELLVLLLFSCCFFFSAMIQRKHSHSYSYSGILLNNEQLTHESRSEARLRLRQQLWQRQWQRQKYGTNHCHCARSSRIETQRSYLSMPNVRARVCLCVCSCACVCLCGSCKRIEAN